MDSDVELIDIEENDADIFDQNTCIDIDVIDLNEGEMQPNFILPEGKDRHLFVSYSAEDSERVWPIVDEIEKRYNLKCVYADRDFQPGMDISENIKIGMQRSWKVLLMLSPNFIQSGWCKYEREFAFVQSVESGINRIIPVLLEDCQRPTTLVTLTYINASEPFCDVAEKVVQAMNNPEEHLPQDDSAKYENGYVVSISAKREPLCYCRPAKYKFVLEEKDVEEMKRVKIQVPRSMLDDAIKILNRCRALQFYDFLESPKRWCCLCAFLLPLTFIGIWTASCVPLFNRSRFSDTKKSYEEIYYTAPCIATPAIILCALGILLLIGFVLPIVLAYRSPNIAKDIHMALWKELARKFLNHNTLLIYSHPRWGPPTVSLQGVRSILLDYIYRKLQSNPETRRENDSEAKEDAFRRISQNIVFVSQRMASNLETLPPAPYTRHRVMKGRACICQCFEEWHWI